MAALGGAPSSLALMGGMRLSIDALSAPVLLVVCLSGAAAAVAIPKPLGIATLGAMLAVPLAADGLSFVVFYALAAATLWAIDPGGQRGRVLVIGVLSLAIAMALLAWTGAGVDIRFAGMPAHPPEGFRAAVILVAMMVTAGCWLACSGPVLPAATAAVSLYGPIRVLVDLCGPAVPVWWSMPVLLLGAGAMLFGGVQANKRDDLLTILAAARIGMAGFVLAGLGVVLAARGADLPPLAALALAGALAHLVSYAVADTLLVLCAIAVADGAGTTTLSGLGGLIRSMPGVAIAMLAGLAAVAGLPLTAGFAGRWLLLQALLGSPRAGGLALQLGLAVVLAAVALGTGLLAAASVRLFGVGVLGRPRTVQAGTAHDPPQPVRAAIAGLLAVCAIIGLWPALVLALVRPASMQVLGVGLDGTGWLLTAAQAEGPIYAAPALAVLLAATGAAIVYLVQWIAGPAAWDGGHDGAAICDPAGQISAGAASHIVLQWVRRPAWWPGVLAWVNAVATLAKARILAAAVQVRRGR